LELSLKNLVTIPTTNAAPNWMQQCKDLFDMLNQTVDDASSRKLRSIPEKQNCYQVNLQMDLQKVREKLRLGSYMTPMDFAKDVRFIFENSKNYYTEKESPNFAMIVRLSAVFEENYSKFLASLKPPKNSASKSLNESINSLLLYLMSIFLHREIHEFKFQRGYVEEG
jgi:bromodomain and WD repeat domain-containing protein 1/3